MVIDVLLKIYWTGEVSEQISLNYCFEFLMLGGLFLVVFGGFVGDFFFVLFKIYLYLFTCNL